MAQRRRNAAPGKRNPTQAAEAALNNCGDAEGGMGACGEAAEPIAVSPVSAQARKMMEDGLEGIVAAVVRCAQEGDMTAAKIVLDRLSPPAGERLVSFTMRPIASSRDTVEAMSDALAAVAEGKITILEASRVMKLLQDFIEMGAVLEFERWLTAIEASAETMNEVAARFCSTP